MLIRKIKKERKVKLFERVGRDVEVISRDESTKNEVKVKMVLKG